MGVLSQQLLAVALFTFAASVAVAQTQAPIVNIGNYSVPYPPRWFVPNEHPTIELFAEEADPFTGHPAATPPATRRIYLVPHIEINELALMIEDANGKWVKDPDAATGPFHVYLPMKIQDLIANDVLKSWLVCQIKNIPTVPAVGFGEETFGFMGGPNDTPAASSRWYLGQYSVEKLSLSAVNIEFRVRGASAGYRNFGASQLSSNSSFAVDFDVADPKLIRDLKRGMFELDVTFLGRVSTSEQGSLVNDFHGLTNAISDEARTEVQKAASSSGGFLFFTTSDSSLSKWVSDVASNSSFTSISQNKSLVLRDVHDSAFMATLRDFLYPATTRDQVIAAHLQEANTAGVNSTLSAADKLYAAALAQPSGSGATVNVAKALAALGSGDMLSFLANGFAFSTSGQSSTAQYRKLRSASINNEDAQRINALLIDQVQLKQAITLANFPYVRTISTLRDNASHELSEQDLQQMLQQQQVGPMAPQFTRATNP